MGKAGSHRSIEASLQTLPASSMAMGAYEALRAAVLETDVHGSDLDLRLDERQLAVRLGVSRTPVREALRRLEQEGLVRIVPRRGVYVVRKTKAELIEVIIVWAALESMAGRLLCERASDVEISKLRKLFADYPTPADVLARVTEYGIANLKFHQRIIELGESPLLAQMAANLFPHMRAIRGRTIGETSRAERSITDHLRIIDAFEARDKELAEGLVKEHALGLAAFVEFSPTLDQLANRIR